MLSRTSVFLAGVAAVQVETEFGRVIGHSATTWDGYGCEEFLGIPYAEQAERFMPPSPWQRSYSQDGLVAANYSAWCPQMDGAGASGDEDCLFLNIWRPLAASPGGNLTVMVWIHGGAFVEGDGGDNESPNTYNGCGLAARHDVIVVSMNYRLGFLGFAAFADAKGGVDANWGLEDQREALRWLQHELSSFGGDSSKVTIFGESAGAQSVWHHLASRRSTGLFRAAISESGMPSAVSSKYRLNETLTFAGLAGCREDVRECLKKQPVKDLIMIAAAEAGEPERHWGPTIDGMELADYPDRLFQHGRTHAVPVLAGINTNEGTCFIYPAHPKGMNERQYRDFVTSTFTGGDRSLNGKDLAELFRRYPPQDQTDLRGLASELFTDVFLCLTANSLSDLSRQTQAFMYRFDHRPSCPRPSAPGVYHGLEIPYVFGTPQTYDCSFSAEEEELSNRMQTMWTNFAKYLNPSSPGETFPEFTGASPKGMVLNVTRNGIDEGYRAGFCKFWKEVWESAELPTYV